MRVRASYDFSFIVRDDDISGARKALDALLVRRATVDTSVSIVPLRSGLALPDTSTVSRRFSCGADRPGGVMRKIEHQWFRLGRSKGNRAGTCALSTCPEITGSDVHRLNDADGARRRN